MKPSHRRTGSVCILPRLEGLGGPVSFQNRLVDGLIRRGVEVHHDPLAAGTAAILVNGGSHHLLDLWRARQRGVRIVQRLNGMNWIHRRRKVGLRFYLRAERNNRLLAFIRRHLADGIIYQSNFAQAWWRTVYGKTRTPARVVYNGVDLTHYTPEGEHERPDGHYRIVLVEGHLGGGNEMGLANAIALAQQLSQVAEKAVELMVVGDVPPALQAHWEEQALAHIVWAGKVSASRIPFIDRSAHLLFSSDLNAACPNSVIEALACGLPVIAFATGSLPELLEGEAGRVVTYGSNYWNLEPPDISALAAAAQVVLADQENYRRTARARARVAFDVDQMVESYLSALLLPT
ncbi:MAG: glycosyltransferase family 4 protein [Anaerolineaceae bacterium]|nr:glycosyltransferase family 4 protein [Anaerolineaceae bacterium]